MKYPPHLLKLIDVLRRLPGVGYKSAERYAFHMLQWPSGHLNELAQMVDSLHQKIQPCQTCGCLCEEEVCLLCHETRGTAGTLCIIASPRDAFAIEETREYKGYYHVLGGLLSPLEGKGPEKLQLPKLLQRLEDLSIKEVVIALDSTLEGDTTALYLKQELEPLQLKISRLAFGLPMGSSLDYVDGGTLARAFLGRGQF
jgi:recombination protein RecR